MGRRYSDPLDAFGSDWTESDVEQCVLNEDDRLDSAPLVATLYGDNCAWAAQICLRLLRHADPTVRGNAVLGLGHLARRFSDLVLDDETADAVGRALNDANSYVRNHALTTCEDIAQFHGKVLRESPGGAVWLERRSR